MPKRIEQPHRDDNPYTACMTYLVAAGDSETAGNNMWARALNACDPLYVMDPKEPPWLATLCVTLDDPRIVLKVNLPNLNGVVARMRKLVLIHEAAHLGLLHLVRGPRQLLQARVKGPRFEILESLLNIALDLDANTHVLRHEPETKWMIQHAEAMQKHGFLLLFPEHFGLPVDACAEEYMLHLLQRLPKLKPTLRKLLDDPASLWNGGDDQAVNQRHNARQRRAERKKVSSWTVDEHDSDDELTRDGAPTQRGRGTAGDAVRAADVPEDQNLADLLKQVVQRANQHTWMDAERLLQMSEKEAAELVRRLDKISKNALRDAIRVTNNIARSRGLASSDSASLVNALLADDPYPWHWLLEDLVGGQVGAKQVDSMRSPALELLYSDDYDPWPGRCWDPTFNVTLVRDSSGSIGSKEYARACLTLTKIMQTDRNVRMRVIDVDAKILHEQIVERVEPSSLARHGAGGTVYVPAFKRILGADDAGDWSRAERFHASTRDEPPPDLVLVVTDGGVVVQDECFPRWRPSCPIYWLVLPGCRPVAGMDDAPPDRVIQMFELDDHLEDV